LRKCLVKAGSACKDLAAVRVTRSLIS